MNEERNDLPNTIITLLQPVNALKIVKQQTSSLKSPLFSFSNDLRFEVSGPLRGESYNVSVIHYNVACLDDDPSIGIGFTRSQENRLLSTSWKQIQELYQPGVELEITELTSIISSSGSRKRTTKSVDTTGRFRKVFRNIFFVPPV